MARARGALALLLRLQLAGVLVSGLLYAPCEDSPNGEPSGLGTRARGFADVNLNRCDVMYDFDAFYAANGIPCGAFTESDCGGVALAFAPTIGAAAVQSLSASIEAELVPGEPLPASLIAQSLPKHLEVASSTAMNITFVSETACFENAIGVISWPTAAFPDPSDWDAAVREQVLEAADVSIVLPIVDGEFCNAAFDDSRCSRDQPYCTVNSPSLVVGATVPLLPGLRNGTSVAQLPFPAGLSVSFFILPDGGLGVVGGGWGSGAEESVENVAFAVDALNSPEDSAAVAFLPSSIAGAPEVEDAVLFSFEDQPKSPNDGDFDDVTFLITFDDISAISNIAPSSAPSPSPSSAAPSAAPSPEPLEAPSSLSPPAPSHTPSAAPSPLLSAAPSPLSSAAPSSAPSSAPSEAPSAAPTGEGCLDGALGGDESDVDCGGACRGCEEGRQCRSGRDCLSGVCVFFFCVSPPPSAAPSPGRSPLPSLSPSLPPSEAPSTAPTPPPSPLSSAAPSKGPSASPSAAPSVSPSAAPSPPPSAAPSAGPSAAPTVSPAPSAAPSSPPSLAPSVSQMPSDAPSLSPSDAPSASPSLSPSEAPTASQMPSAPPSEAPSEAPSERPSGGPTAALAVLPFDFLIEAAVPDAAAADCQVLLSPLSLELGGSADGLRCLGIGASDRSGRRALQAGGPALLLVNMSALREIGGSSAPEALQELDAALSSTFSNASAVARMEETASALADREGSGFESAVTIFGASLRTAILALTPTPAPTPPPADGALALAQDCLRDAAAVADVTSEADASLALARLRCAARAAAEALSASCGAAPGDADAVAAVVSSSFGELDRVGRGSAAGSAAFTADLCATHRRIAEALPPLAACGAGNATGAARRALGSARGAALRAVEVSLAGDLALAAAGDLLEGVGLAVGGGAATAEAAPAALEVFRAHGNGSAVLSSSRAAVVSGGAARSVALESGPLANGLAASAEVRSVGGGSLGVALVSFDGGEGEARPGARRVVYSGVSSFALNNSDATKTVDISFRRDVRGAEERQRLAEAACASPKACTRFGAAFRVSCQRRSALSLGAFSDESGCKGRFLGDEVACDCRNVVVSGEGEAAVDFVALLEAEAVDLRVRAHPELLVPLGVLLAIFAFYLAYAHFVDQTKAEEAAFRDENGLFRPSSGSAALAMVRRASEETIVGPTSINRRGTLQRIRDLYQQTHPAQVRGGTRAPRGKRGLR